MQLGVGGRGGGYYSWKLLAPTSWDTALKVKNGYRCWGFWGMVAVVLPPLSGSYCFVVLFLFLFALIILGEGG